MDQVFIYAVDLNRVAVHALRFEADLLVKLDGAAVVFPDRQFDTVKSECPGRDKRSPDQACADSLSAERKVSGKLESLTAGEPSAVQQ